jgi:CubicO group peptidase (beta-lactamase class C family)
VTSIPFDEATVIVLLWMLSFNLPAQESPASSAAEKPPASSVADQPAPPFHPPSEAAIRKLVQPIIDRGESRAIVVGVTSPSGRTVVGFGRTRDDLPTTPGGDSLFEIGSISKVFNGVLLAESVRRGEVRLDESVASVFEKPAGFLRRSIRPVRLEDLATHRSGLPRMPGNFEPKNADDPYADYTPELLFRYLDKLKPLAEPGESFAYSNLAAGLLGQALERRTGRSWKRLLAERITGPLGMRDTMVDVTADRLNRFVGGHDDTLTPTASWDIGALVAAGGIRSTTNDLLTFLEAALERRPTPLAEAFALSTRLHAPPVGKGPANGLGWFLAGGTPDFPTHEPGDIGWHNGGTGGYRTWLLFDRRRMVGVVVLTTGNGPVPEQIGGALFDSLSSGVIKPLKRPPLAPPIPAAEAEAIAGKYSFLGVTMTVEPKTSFLSFQLSGQPRVRFDRTGERVYRHEALKAEVTFERDAAGKITAATLRQNGLTLPYKRI